MTPLPSGAPPGATRPGLGEDLVLDELFDVTLYRRLALITRGNTRRLLETLIPTEQRHYEFWKEFFGLPIERLDWARRAKLRLLLAVCRLFGDPAVQLVLESIEIYGTRKYLEIWEQYRGTELSRVLKGIMEDELQHEDDVVSSLIERRIDAGKVRNLFLGMNDGLVETLGAVNGFFAAFSSLSSVLMAGLLTSVAGAVSMGAGAFVATSSEGEVEDADRRKKSFLQGSDPAAPPAARPLSTGVLVGLSYLLGALVPLLPVLAGAKSVAISLVMGGGALVAVSFSVALLSGMNIRRRIAQNVSLLGGALFVTYLVGLVIRRIWGLRA